jgi:signal transduction histidine kinase
LPESLSGWALNKFWQNFRPAYLLTWPVFFTTYIWSLLVHFTDSMINGPGFLLKRLIVITGLQLLVFLIVYMAIKVFVDRIKAAYVPVALLLAVAVAALFRGYIFEYWLNAWEITEEFNLSVRMRASLLNLSIAFVISTLAVANTRRHHMINSKFILERQRLELTRSNAQISIAELDKTLISSIESQLRVHVNELRSKDAKEVLPLLRNLIDQVVQPLSRRIQSEYTPWSPPLGQPSKLQIRWREVLGQSFRPNQVKYLSIPLLMIVIAIPTVTSKSSLSDTLWSMLQVYLAAIIVGKFFRFIFRNSGSNPITYLLVIFATALAMGLASLDLTKDYENRYALVAPAFALYVLAALVTSVLTSREQAANFLTLELSQTVKEMQWSVSRIREDQRQRYQSLSRYLHGHLQALLASKYLEIEKMDPALEDNPLRLSAIISEIEKEVGEINRIEDSSENILEVVEKIVESWDKIAKIEPEFKPEVLAKIESDQLCRSALVDVLPELVFNGIKHGQATNLQIKVDLIDLSVVRLVITDNGSFELVEKATGIGTQILNESCISWDRVRKDATTVTTADFALSL